MTAYFTEGFSVREPMWHGLGAVLADYPDWEQAPILAGHDFTVVEQPVFTKLDRTFGDEALVTTTYPELKGYKAVSNSKTGTVFAVHNETYELIQNPVGWEIAELLVGKVDNVKVETAGVLKDGRVCWILLRVDEPYSINGDDSETYPFVTVNWAHDGSAAMRAFPTDVRVVCWNTLSVADQQADRDGRAFTFRHTKNVAARIEDAKAIMSGVRASSAQYRELADELAVIPVTDEQREQFIKMFIPAPIGDVISDRVVSNITDARESVRALFTGPTIPEAHRNTAYGLVQAGVEYANHLRRANNAGTQFGRSLLRPDPMQAKVVATVKELVSV